MKQAFLGLSVLLCWSPPAASAPSEDFRPAVIYESGSGKNDFGFIDLIKKGASQAKEDIGIQYEEFRMPASANRVTFMEHVAQSGVTHIIAVGFQNVLPVLSLADKYPEVKFTVIDGIVPPLFSNVQSISFKDHEGAFLVGMIAGYQSPTNKVGFIGGMDVPLINNFAFGFYQGARQARPDIEWVRESIVKDSKPNSHAVAWNSPEKAKALAKKMYHDDVGVVFAAAGGSSVGVLEAAQEMGKLAIGVDTNQNGLYPGAVLTSMVKRVDKVVYDTLSNSFSGRWEPGIKYLGIREGALDYAVDVNNKSLVTKEVIDKVEDAKDRIIRGLLNVEMYSPY